ncbi:MAG: hypothetical protein HYU35_00595 [Parcubacteria group bacterium]|nr:hypothetical protein [Parcubacteria group bacterium]
MAADLRPKMPGRGMGIFALLGLFLLVLTLAFGGVVLFYGRLQQGRVAALQESFGRAEAEFEPALVAEFTRVSRTIDASKTLVKQHTSLSRVFEFLEEATLPEVRFTTFSFSVETLTLVMNGEAKGYTKLSQQAIVFEQSQFVERVKLSNLSLIDSGRVGFALQLVLKPELLQFF